MTGQASATLSWLDDAGAPFPAIAAATLLFLTAWALGRFLVPRFNFWTSFDHHLIEVVAGLVGLSTLAATIGPFGWLASGQSIVVLITLATILISAAYWTRRNVRGPGGAAERPPQSARHAGRTAATALLTLPLLFTLGPALVLPDGWDELVYHIELPRRWLAAGRPSVDLDLPYSAFPSAPELLFWLVSPIDLYLVPRLINWCVWAIAIAILYRVSRRFVSAWEAAVLTLAFALGDAVLMVSANCYVEAFLLAYVAAFLMCVTESGENRSAALRGTGSHSSGNDWRGVLLPGLLLGGAASVKLTGLVVLTLPLVAFVPTSRRSVRPFAIVLTVAVAICLPFYVRSADATGNPFFPYFESWFTAEPDRLQASQFHHSVAEGFGVRSASTFVTGPILLAFNQDLYDGQFGGQLVVLLGLAAVTLIRTRRDSTVVVPAVTAAMFYVTWFLTAQQARFVAPAVLATAIVAAHGLATFEKRGRISALALIAATTMIALPWGKAGYYFSSWETLAGYWTRIDNLNEGTQGSYLPVVEAVESYCDADSRVLLLFEHRGLYFRPHCEIGTPGFRAGGVPVETDANPQRLLDWLRSRQLTHIVLSKTPAGPDQTPEWRKAVEPVYRSLESAIPSGLLVIRWESPTHMLISIPERQSPSR